MSFKIGDRVVYPQHGAAIIERTEVADFNGVETKFLIVRTADGELTIRVPASSVDDVGLRPPISLEDAEDLFELLSKKDVREPANWSRRYKNHQEKLKSGDVYQVAEVVRNLALREKSKGLSAGEKKMYNDARKFLVSELSFALDVPEENALDRVETTLNSEPAEGV